MDFQVLREIATGKAREAGYTNFADRGDLNLSLFDIETYPAMPEGLVVEPFKSNADVIEETRAAMLAEYGSAAIDLRSVFSTNITEINGLLDLADFELALAKAQAVDTSVITDPTLKAQADTFKANFVAALQVLANLD